MIRTGHLCWMQMQVVMQKNVASAEGLVEITELNEYRYMTALNPGESTDVYVNVDLRRRGHGQCKWD